MERRLSVGQGDCYDDLYREYLPRIHNYIRLRVNGEDLAAAGIPKGPDMGKVLSFLLEAVIDDPELNRHDSLIDMAVRFYNQRIARG